MHTPTDEQAEAIEVFLSHKNLVVSAAAGSGKTSMLSMMANSDNRKGLYLAFNKSIVEEMKDKFPAHVQAKTLHSLAFGHQRSIYSSAQMTSNIKPWVMASELVIGSFNGKRESGDSMYISSNAVASLVKMTVEKYCNSEDLELSKSHTNVSSPIFGDCGLDTQSRKRLQPIILKIAKSLWDDMCDPDSDTPIGFSGYLKRYAMDAPALNVDYIMIDECQDSNGVTMQIIKQQMKRGVQIIMVGDGNQAIYQWRGSVDIMDQLHDSELRHLTKTFRFGSAIASAANSILDIIGGQKSMEGVGPEGNTSIDQPYPTRLYRTNSAMLYEAIQEMVDGKKVHIAGGSAAIEKELRHVSSLKDGKPVQDISSDFFGFQDWDEVSDFCNDDGADNSVALLYRLVQEHGVRQIKKVLEDTVSESRADIVVSTLHKAKGREWDSVSLGDDFKVSGNNKSPEYKILYVAMTRAKKLLSIPSALLSDLRSEGHTIQINSLEAQ